MPETIISNAAHTALRRNAFKELGIFISGHRVPGTTFWRVWFSNTTLADIVVYQTRGETLSDTIIKMFTLYDRIRRPHAQPPTSTTTH